MTTQAHCDFCQAEFARPTWAPHKRFCCSAHRDAWHSAERKRALAALRELESGEKVSQPTVEGPSGQAK